MHRARRAGKRHFTSSVMVRLPTSFPWSSRSRGSKRLAIAVGGPLITVLEGAIQCGPFADAPARAVAAR